MNGVFKKANQNSGNTTDCLKTNNVKQTVFKRQQKLGIIMHNICHSWGYVF